MKCAEVQEILSHDRFQAERPEIARHLEGCGECREFLEDLCEIEELCLVLRERVRAPRGFAAHVFERCHRRPGLPAWSLVPILGVALAVTLGWWAAADGNLGVTGDRGEILGRENLVPPPRVADSQPNPGPRYVDVVVPGEDGRPLIVRVPSVIEIRNTRVAEDYYINHVSH
ncbi:MAG: hypothetical protein Kow00109_19980 [Acidobacteriota bacterium]